MVAIASRIRSFFVGRSSITDFGDRYPVLDRSRMSSIGGLYVVGNVATIVVFLNRAFPGSRVLGESSSVLTRVYGGFVDVWLIAIVPVALYPFLGGKVWCRYWCPSAVYMQAISHLLARLAAKGRRIRHATYAIFSRRERCIACNLCTRYCEVGIDVRRFAVKGRTFDNTNSSCIGCGICISVCPTERLSFDESFGGRRPLDEVA